MSLLSFDLHISASSSGMSRPRRPAAAMRGPKMAVRREGTAGASAGGRHAAGCKSDQSAGRLHKSEAAEAKRSRTQLPRENGCFCHIVSAGRAAVEPFQ